MGSVTGLFMAQFSLLILDDCATAPLKVTSSISAPETILLYNLISLLLGIVGNRD